MQNQQNILLVIETEDTEKDYITHCHFKAKMTFEEKRRLINTLVRTVEDLLSGNLEDNKKIYDEKPFIS